jgi:hypothetical protein
MNHAGDTPEGVPAVGPIDYKIGHMVLNGVYVNTLRNDGISFPPRYAPVVDGNGNGTRAFSTTFSGQTIGIPGTARDRADATINADVKMADFQLWTDVYIDPTDSTTFSKFVTVSGGVGKPVSPTTAAAAFGTQTLLFQGDSNHFYINLGSGGNFTKSGTLSDYTPSPTY